MKNNKWVKNRRTDQNEYCPYNAGERIRQFKKSLEDFYNRIEKDWLSMSTISEHQVVIKEREFQIFENGLGDYVVDGKEMIVDNCHVFLKPLGTVFEGVWGQIDLICGARSEMFVLIRKDIFFPKQLLDSINMDASSIPLFPSLKELEWKYVSKYPDLKYETIDSRVFLNTIMKVIHG